MCAAREVDPAQQRAHVHAGAAENLGDELVQHVLQRRELLREAENLGAATGFALILEALPDAPVESCHELVEFVAE